jgi:hypothetical protein
LDGTKFGGAPHPDVETWNDSKVSPDGKYFAGTVDNDRIFGNDNKDVQDIYWTMDGKNKLAPFLYRFDI